jgi:hypothetical protein
MTEDGLGNLYTVTYTIGFAQPIMLKSTNGGASWTKIGNFSVVHFHTIKYTLRMVTFMLLLENVIVRFLVAVIQKRFFAVKTMVPLGALLLQETMR